MTEEDFPGLICLIGNDTFWQIAEDYLMENPSRSFTLRHPGDRLPEHLQKHIADSSIRRRAVAVSGIEFALMTAFEAAAKDADLVLGNRNSLPQSRASLTWPQRFGNALAGWLIWLRWGTRFGDLGPLRLIRRTSLERLKMEDRGFGWTVEMQAKAAARRLKTREIPVCYFPRRGGKSKISGTVSGTVKAGSVILGTLAKLWLRKTPHV